jgi:hypothetical protein
MINGVLVERTVRDVVPALTTNAEGLKKVLDDLVKQYKVQQEKLEQWKVCNPQTSFISNAYSRAAAEKEQCPSRAVIGIGGHSNALWTDDAFLTF